MQDRVLPIAYFVLQLLGGHIGLPLLVLTFLLSRKVPRRPTVINLCIVWILYSVTYCLSLYGRNNFKSNPPQQLCFVQAAMVHGAPCMAVVAVLIVVVKIWSTFYEPWKSIHLDRLPQWAKSCAILLPPYVVFAVFSIIAGIMGMRRPESIYVSNHIYCTTDINALYWATPLFCGIVLLGITGFEVAIILRYYKGWRLIKKLSPDAETRAKEISPWVRAAIFFLNSWLALGVSITFMAQAENPLLYIVQALLPLVAFLICGLLQKDILQAWFTDDKLDGVPETSARHTVRHAGISPAESIFVITISSVAATSPVYTISSCGAIECVV
ncbi:hypothetical protein OBBRIDRAFT_746913 [Obba rivulosa]|uniref:Uncharacterized protein n=1 Tax=Obba rivulosa TaxID=1052685 RepID=A0A8E2DS56_9APHY|nr:hypothetical protein OBBRIDRAFT_746913 [Obba rivulosa]